MEGTEGEEGREGWLIYEGGKDSAVIPEALVDRKEEAAEEDEQDRDGDGDGADRLERAHGLRIPPEFRSGTACALCPSL